MRLVKGELHSTVNDTTKAMKKKELIVGKTNVFVLARGIVGGKNGW